MQYIYQIAGISVLCEIPFPVNIRKESADFIHQVKDEIVAPDVVVKLCPVSKMVSMPPDGHWEIDRYYTSSSVYYCSSLHGEPYVQVKGIQKKDRCLICEYIKGKENYLNYSRNLCDIIALDTLLLNHNGLLLHASFIRWQEKGILFSAPSGTGKSTQADLWVKYEHAEIINGDRAGLRLMDGYWTAWGLPYAGSSGIYRNESAPIKAIVVLRQAKENHMRLLRPSEAMRYLYPEVTIHHWDKAFTEQAMNLLTELVTGIPVYLLECLPDQGAVELVKNTIFEDERKGC